MRLLKLIAPMQKLLLHRDLVFQLVKREIAVRYRGSIAGILWSFVTPIFMLGIYTFFFSIVYQARWGTHVDTNKLNFAITLFAGLIPFSLFSECINKAPSLIINNVNYVKKIIFPLEILSWTNLGSALFHAMISVAVLLAFFLWQNHYVNWTVVLLPLVNLPLLFLILGLSWFLASVGVFVRDVAHSINLFTMALLFLSPVFYSIDMIPQAYQKYIYLNPLTAIIEFNRDVLIWGQLPNWYAWGISLMACFCVMLFGYAWFAKTKPAFADVV